MTFSVDTLTPVLSVNWGEPQSWKITNYESHGGYQALRKALTKQPSEIIDEVKASNLRGRGGAGFPTGMKWSFIPQDNPNPKYLVVNGDESEPGTCKDMPLLMANPHAVVEGSIITSYAVNAHLAVIYIRGEVVHVIRRVQQAVREAYAAGYLGKNVLGSGFDMDIIVHAGAGAYICGEETALLDSLEGRRGQPRLKPPFPAVAGLYGGPTVINNVESVSSIPSIIANGAKWFNSMGTEGSKGYTLYSVSGHVKYPGQYEGPLGMTLRQLLELSGGMRDGHQLKFFTAGGSSMGVLSPEHIDVPMDFDELRKVGSGLGTKAVQVFDETTSVVRATLRWMEFYKHESCGKCTPCREGSWWLVQMLRKFEAGQAREGDIEKMLDLLDNVTMKSFCPLADGFVGLIRSATTHFRDEFEAGFTTAAWELFPYEKSALFTVEPKGDQ